MTTRFYKTFYLVSSNPNGVHITDNVSYLDRRDYLVEMPIPSYDSKTSFEVISGLKIQKLTDENADLFLEVIHKSCHSDLSRGTLQLKTMSGMYNVYDVYHGGLFKDDSPFCPTMCVIDCPANIFKFDLVTIVPTSRYTYSVVPCDAHGNPYRKKSRRSEGFTPACNMVYNAIDSNPGISTIELIDFLGWEDRRVTARLSELTAAQRVKCISKVINPRSGRLISCWEVF